ncbi:MAG: hypothetical protein V4726_08805 [Verrucomicrobiota bacterium]
MSDSSEIPSSSSGSDSASPGGGGSSSSSQDSNADSDPETAAPSGGGDDSGNGTDPKKRRYSQQDKLIQANITDSQVFLKVAAGDPRIRPLLEARGYDDAEFAAGQALAAAASAAFEERAGAMGDQEESTEGLLGANQAARQDYATFRIIARASFPEKSDRLSLSLAGGVPEDTSRFITLATTSYNAGKKPPFDTRLTRRGYDPATLDQHLLALDALTGTIAGHDESQGEAIADTAARDSAYDKLRIYMKELKGVARGALRTQPGLLAKLGL